MLREYELLVRYLFELISTERDGKKPSIYLKELKRILEAKPQTDSLRPERSGNSRAQ
jgi:hypothetical protein